MNTRSSDSAAGPSVMAYRKRMPLLFLGKTLVDNPMGLKLP